MAESAPTTDRFVPLCRSDALGEGQGLAVRMGESEIALFRVGNEVYALDNRCPHSGGPLAEGILTGTHVTCSWHCATFDLKTGESLDSISRWDSETYPVRIREGRIWVGLPYDEERR